MTIRLKTIYNNYRSRNEIALLMTRLTRFQLSYQQYAQQTSLP